jgi:hypothetical protein
MMLLKLRALVSQEKGNYGEVNQKGKNFGELGMTKLA